MRLCALLLVFPFTLAAQIGGGGQIPNQTRVGGQATPAATRSAPEDLCTIQGQVLNVSTGEPLKKANLNLQRADMAPDMMSMPTSYSTSTDASGKFAMKDIEPGQYRLSVTRNGHATVCHPAISARVPATVLVM